MATSFMVVGCSCSAALAVRVRHGRILSTYFATSSVPVSLLMLTTSVVMVGRVFSASPTERIRHSSELSAYATSPSILDTRSPGHRPRRASFRSLRDRFIGAGTRRRTYRFHWLVFIRTIASTRYTSDYSLRIMCTFPMSVFLLLYPLTFPLPILSQMGHGAPHVPLLGLTEHHGNLLVISLARSSPLLRPRTNRVLRSVTFTYNHVHIECRWLLLRIRRLRRSLTILVVQNLFVCLRQAVILKPFVKTINGWCL